MADVDRGVSTVLGYSLNLVVATLLVTGVLVAAGSLVDSQRDQAARAELNVVGERLVANLETADRLARSTDDGHVAVDASLPTRIAGSAYEVVIVTDGDAAEAVVILDNPDQRVVVPIHNGTPIEESRHPGGPLTIHATDSGPLEVTDDK
ncbi:Pilin/Flagellin, FlaG/FlaF family [Halanaeroarchaeum sp. HSR-CO]|uniref:DUF7266 family protein n=1 Tax=Halanaeroarchaeum sp. HSR-CO TaxID=2866382 RepID=UPI00217DC0FB|nr:hypothetical protein [Halanaeroarchaeum sp. HSR-CO]UWG47716.1 Pilin/Flagellin, FlaG/FlaF family [Halanaeroarchaeum sp. HSR-CO]